MNDLGHLAWWRIVGDGLTHSQVADALTDVELPDKPLPFDVFRRVTNVQYEFTLDDLSVVLSTNQAEASDKMILRHIVATASKGGAVQDSRVVGDAAFYRPPRGKNSKARLRVALRTMPEEWKLEVAKFAAQIRATYDAGIKGTLDAQAIRRLVRSHVTKSGGLYLDGPWYVQELEVVERLHPLFDLLNDECFIHTVPYVDTEANRWFLLRGLERTIKAGTPVDETIWTRLEAS